MFLMSFRRNHYQVTKNFQCFALLRGGIALVVNKPCFPRSGVLSHETPENTRHRMPRLLPHCFHQLAQRGQHLSKTSRSTQKIDAGCKKGKCRPCCHTIIVNNSNVIPESLANPHHLERVATGMIFGSDYDRIRSRYIWRLSASAPDLVQHITKTLTFCLDGPTLPEKQKVACF